MLNNGWLTEKQADEWFGIIEESETKTEQSADVRPKPAWEKIYPAAR
jgi:hypothetical protein